MKYILAMAIIAILSSGTCGDHKKGTSEKNTVTNGTGKEGGAVTDSIPTCVRAIIQSGTKEEPDVPVRVDEYLFKGKRTFLFIAPCCDQFNVLYDDNCQALCAPSGGFTGRGDGKCPDFDSTNAKLIRTVWTKPAK